MKHNPHRHVPRTGNKRYVNLTLTHNELKLLRRVLDIFGDGQEDCYSSRAMNSLWQQVLGAELRLVDGRSSVTRADLLARRLNAESVSE